jgi:hypothetical protein
MPSRRNLYFTVIEKIQLTPQGNDREKYANVLQSQRAGMVEAGTGAAPNGPREPRSFRASFWRRVCRVPPVNEAGHLPLLLIVTAECALRSRLRGKLS